MINEDPFHRSIYLPGDGDRRPVGGGRGMVKG